MRRWQYFVQTYDEIVLLPKRGPRVGARDEGRKKKNGEKKKNGKERERKKRRNGGEERSSQNLCSEYFSPSWHEMDLWDSHEGQEEDECKEGTIQSRERLALLLDG